MPYVVRICLVLVVFIIAGVALILPGIGHESAREESLNSQNLSSVSTGGVGTGGATTLSNRSPQLAVEEPPRWPSWRGPLGSGEALDAAPPTEWDEATNVRWKTALPGLGHSSPVVWDDRIYLTSAIAIGAKFDPIPDGAPGSHDNLEVEQRHQLGY